MLIRLLNTLRFFAPDEGATGGPATLGAGEAPPETGAPSNVSTQPAAAPATPATTGDTAAQPATEPSEAASGQPEWYGKRLGQYSEQTRTLKSENATLRQQLAEMQKQLAERQGTSPTAQPGWQTPAAQPTGVTSPKEVLSRLAHYRPDGRGNLIAPLLDEAGAVVFDEDGNVEMDVVPEWQVQQLQHAAWLEEQVSTLKTAPEQANAQKSAQEAANEAETRVNTRTMELVKQYFPNHTADPDKAGLAAFLVQVTARMISGEDATAFDHLEDAAKAVRDFFGADANEQLKHNIAAAASEAVPQGGSPALVDTPWNKLSEEQQDQIRYRRAKEVLAQLE